MVSQIALLIIKYTRAEISADEQLELNEWINASDDNAKLFRELIETDSIKKDLRKFSTYNEESVRSKIEAKLPGAFLRKAKERTIWFRVAAAAAVLVLFGSGIYFYFNYQNNKKLTEQKNQLAARDIAAPEKNRATITLSNGQKIFLDSVASGTIATQKNVEIKKNDDGVISYNGNEQPKTEMVYNTLTNPRGSKVIDITLSDGTQVWLNAASSLKYPVAFSGNERQVEITGEAYFEVVHNSKMPFKVKANNELIEDLGTHFNINAYDNEPDTKITLLEGSIKIAINNDSKILKPGQQVQVSGTEIKIVDGADLEQAIAWKNGIFKYKETNITEIMREVERWYDVDVEYKGDVKALNFGGVISRKAYVSELLKLLEATGTIKFTIEDKKITVSPI